MVILDLGNGTTARFDNTQLVKLNDGQIIRADALQTGDVFLIREGDFVTITGGVTVA